MTIQEILAGGGGLLLILMTLVQIAPVKINPWSALAKAIGKAINADISKRLDEIEKKLDSHIKTDDQGRADDWRAAILHFFILYPRFLRIQSPHALSSNK